MDRKNIGILLLGGNDWVGGLYYVLNIIRSLNSLEDDEKPNIIAFYGNIMALDQLNQIEYPYLMKVDYNKNLAYKIYSKAVAKITNRDFRCEKLCAQYRLDSLYPYNYAYKTTTNTKIIAWFPDFQHKFLPKLFSQKDLDSRDNYLSAIQTKIDHLVFSSEDAKGHFEKFYPDSKLNLYTLPFVSSVKLDQLLEKEEVLVKYGIEGDYFIVPNQFWQHKNHKVVLEAIQKLREAGTKVQVVFTGKTEDYRNPDYFQQIEKYIDDHVLNDQVHILGFIDRMDQLSLMAHSKGIIQPSTFEGWGTVVEDGKTLGKQIIVSDIPVHHEQLEGNAYYFEASDSSTLASIIDQFLKDVLPEIHKYVPVYERNKLFARQFLKIMGS